MSIDIEREDTKRKIEDLVYSFFLNQLREHQVDEKEWGYFAAGCAEQFLKSAQVSARADLVKQDMRKILKEKILHEDDVERNEALSELVAEIRTLKAGDPVPEELVRKMEKLWGLQ
jgi:hypothetical protein